jgi:hypothetical protein
MFQKLSTSALPVQRFPFTKSRGGRITISGRSQHSSGGRLRMDLITDDSSGLYQCRLDRSREYRLNNPANLPNTLKPHLQCGFFYVVTPSRFRVFGVCRSQINNQMPAI